MKDCALETIRSPWYSFFPMSRCWASPFIWEFSSPRAGKRFGARRSSSGCWPQSFYSCSAERLPLWGAQYDTKIAYSGFILQQIGRALLFAAATALTITLVLPAAEPLYRSSQPDRLSLRGVFTRRGLRSKDFSPLPSSGCVLPPRTSATWWLLPRATRLGAWAPQELNYSDSVNTLFPWISGFCNRASRVPERGVYVPPVCHPLLPEVHAFAVDRRDRAGISLEFPAQQLPAGTGYIRGIEIGLSASLRNVMLRWGIIATLIWHYTVDALLWDCC